MSFIHPPAHPAASPFTHPPPAATTAAQSSLAATSAAPFSTATAFSSQSAVTLAGAPNTRPQRRTSSAAAEDQGYRPVACRTEGVRVSCLVNASVTVCGNDSIYAFGGFDQYTDEVFNHVLKLDLKTYTWTLVDNYGDIPSVRMGHTTTYWRDDKLIIFGGENEQRVFLSDVYIFDIPTATWSQPVLSGHPPCGRSRHTVALHDDRLFVLGGIHKNPNRRPAPEFESEDEGDYNPQEVLDDMCYLDLKTMTWSKSWKWVGRFDHHAWVKDEKLWIFGGMGKEMDRTGELVSLDLKHPVFARAENKQPGYATRQAQPQSSPAHGRILRSHRSYGPNSPRPLQSRGRNTPPPRPNPVPATTTSIRFLWGRDIPSEAHGSHFHHMIGGKLLDFVTSANTRPGDTGLCALDLSELTWRRHADGTDLLGSTWRWHYLAANPDSTMVYLLGCAAESEDMANAGGEEYLSDILPIDLSRLGFYTTAPAGEQPIPGMLGWDLAVLFDREDTGTDFIVRAMKDEAAEGDEYDMTGVWGRNVITPTNVQDVPMSTSAPSSQLEAEDTGLPPEDVMGPPIRVHTLILLSRWKHFQSVYSSRMAEYHRGRIYLPEPYSVVRAFLYYLYSDSISPSTACPDLDLATIAGLLVIANLYDMPRLRTLCLQKLYEDLDVDSAAVVWERAGVAGEEALRKKAAGFVLAYWGRVVRTSSFKRLSRRSLMELCEEVDEEGRVCGGDEAAVAEDDSETEMVEDEDEEMS